MINNIFIDQQQAQELVELECEKTVHFGKRGHDFKEERLAYRCLYCDKTIMKSKFYLIVGTLAIILTIPLLFGLI